MENWGLVTYREVSLLIDSVKSSAIQKVNVALTVAHEMAHLWFGDLVTMKWWTDLWLKEGFASYMSFLFIGYNYPEYNIWLQFLNDELSVGLRLDALRSSYPIEVEINNPNELTEIFDSITYAKSNCVIRMLCYYLGETTFQKGLRLYLKKYQFGNAVTQDLWDALSQASGKDINALMSSWTTQMGFPLISVEQRQEGHHRILHLKQRRFIADGGDDDDEPAWQVPITISVGSDPSSVKCKFLLTEKVQTFTVENVKKEDWVKLNAGASGFFRVEYSDDMLDAFVRDFKMMPVPDRFNITSDLFALVSCGRAPASQFFSLLEASVDEDELVVWRAIDGGLAALSAVLIHADTDGSLKKRFNSFVRKILAPVGVRLGWEVKPGEEPETSMLRSLVQNRLAISQHIITIDQAMQLFTEHICFKKRLHPDLRETIYATAVRCGNLEAFNAVLNIFETDGFAEVERQCLNALSQTESRALLDKLFNCDVKEGKIRAQDLTSLFTGSAVTKVDLNYIWSYFKENLPLFLEKLGGVNAVTFQRCIQSATNMYCSEEVAQDVEMFFHQSLDVTSVHVIERKILQATEIIHLNKTFGEKYGYN